MISQLEKLLGTPRDGALLRYSIGLARQGGNRERAIEYLREAVARDPLYSAAWKVLGKTLTELHQIDAALDAYRQGIEAAKKKGDRQAEKEMTVFARRLEKARPRNWGTAGRALRAGRQRSTPCRQARRRRRGSCRGRFRVWKSVIATTTGARCWPFTRRKISSPRIGCEPRSSSSTSAPDEFTSVTACDAV